MERRIPLTILLTILAGTLSAKNRASDFQIKKIDRELITPPQYNYSGAENLHESRDRWLKIDVQFAAFLEYTPEVTFKYYILIGGKLLGGEVTHVNVLAGKELYSSIYVPPNALTYVLGNRSPTTSAVENVAVQIVEKGEVKDELSLNRARSQWFAALPVVAGLVVNKNETPYAPLFWDHYEQIKPAAH